MVKLTIGSLAILVVCLINFIDCMPHGYEAEADDDGLVKQLTPEQLELLQNLPDGEPAEQWSGQFQGDIIISERQLREFAERKGRTGLVETRFRWPNDTVPVLIVDGYFDQEQIDYIHLGFKTIQDTTCIKFVEYDPNLHVDYVAVQGENSGCWSYVGRRGGRQAMNLQLFAPEVGCFRLYTIAHEMLHALGFFHMQSASDRDDWVEIVWENIQAGTENNFVSYGSSYIEDYGIDYDYGSVMHYTAGSFSINGSATIIPLRDLNGETMGQRVRLSERDILRVNEMYQCQEEVTTTTTTAAPSVTTPRPPVVAPVFPINDILLVLRNYTSDLLRSILSNIRLS